MSMQGLPFVGLLSLIALTALACTTPGSTPTQVPATITHQLEVIADPPEAADFLLNPQPLGQGGYLSGRTVTIDVLPKRGWKLEEWVGPVFSVSGRTAKIEMKATHTVVVRLVRLPEPTATLSPTTTEIPLVVILPTATPRHTSVPPQTSRVIVVTATPRPTTPRPTPRKRYLSTPQMEINPASNYTATIKTNKGNIVIELFPATAPKTVNNFVFLANMGFYNGVIFHRVIPSFMIQGGDPTGTGTSGPGYKFEDEIDTTLVFDKPGILAMANSGPDTNGSQFFITTVPTPHLNGNHTIFGKVLEGQDVVNTISAVPTGRSNKPIVPVTIRNIEITAVTPTTPRPTLTPIPTATPRVVVVTATPRPTPTRTVTPVPRPTSTPIPQLRFGFLREWNHQLRRVNDVAVDSAGNVFVLDNEKHRVLVFDASGRLLRQIGGFGFKDGQFNEPEGIDTDGFGNIYVADTLNNRVQKISSQGRFLMKWGSFGSSEGKFVAPKDVALDSSGNVYVIDTNRRVQVFDSAGRFLRQWPTNIAAEGGSSNPYHILVSKDGKVYVAADGFSKTIHEPIYQHFPLPGRVLVFNENGVLLRQMSGTAFGMATDRESNVYLSRNEDHLYNHNEAVVESTEVFNAQGQPFAGFNSGGRLSVDDLGRVYVVQNAGLVQVFAPIR